MHVTIPGDPDPSKYGDLSCDTDCPVIAEELSSATPAVQPDTSAPSPSKDFRGRGSFRMNVVTNIINFGFSAGVAMFLTPYLMLHLGVAAYGLVPLANTTVNYLQVLLVSVVGAVGRFLTIAVEQQNVKQANHVFNTAFFSGTALLLVITGPALVGAKYANVIFAVPAGQERNFSLLLLCAFGMFAFNQLGAIFSVSAFARNRLDLNNLTYIVGTVFRVGALVLFFSLFTPSIVHVGFGLLASGLCTLIGGVLVWRYLMPGLALNIRAFDKGTLRQMTGMSGWMVVTQVGTMLYLSIDLIVVNRLFGPDAGGRYGAVLTWAIMLRSIASTVTSAIAPAVVALYARGNIQALAQYVRHATRLLGFVIALPIGLICGFAAPLLRLWLHRDPSFVAWAPLMVLLTIHICVNSGVGPLFSVNQAANKVRVVGIVTCIGGVMNLGLAFLLAGPVGWGVYGVAAAGAIMLTLKNALFTPIYSAQVLGLPKMTFMRETWMPNISLLVLVAAGLLLSRVLPISNWFYLLGLFATITALYTFIIFRFVLSTEERGIMLRVVGIKS
jgi:O-antigen/teichoic acid export membrane protein